MTPPQLISHHLCPYVQRAVIVLSEKDIAHTRTYIDLADKPDWFSKISPLGRVPILQQEGAVLFESQVIVEYLNEVTPGSLHPSAPIEKARHRSWIEYGSETLNAIGQFYNAGDAKVFEEKRAILRSKFLRIEQEIEGPFFSGETFHMIDGVWGTIFRYFNVFDQIGYFGILSDLEKTNAWRDALGDRPSIINAVPERYEERLMVFLRNKKSHLSTLIADNSH